MAADEASVRRSEARWAVVVAVAVALHRNPPSNLERIDPKSLHLTGEFTEPNLGTRLEDGQVVVRIVMTQFAFVPRCVAVPEGQPVTLRLASPDVIHGLLVTGTNVNTM